MRKNVQSATHNLLNIRIDMKKSSIEWNKPLIEDFYCIKLIVSGEPVGRAPDYDEREPA